MVQADSGVADSAIGHPTACDPRERKRLACARYNKSARQKLRRKLREAGIPKCEMDLMMRAEFPVRRTR